MNLWTPRRANCLIWAVGMQLSRGGYVCWRKSLYGWWPHAVWSHDGREWYEYTPMRFSGSLRWWQVPRLIAFLGAPHKVERDRL